MTSPWWESATTHLATLVTGGVGVAWFTRRKTSAETIKITAEAESVSVATMIVVLEQVRRQVADLEATVNEQQAQIDELRATERDMRANLAAHGQWDLLVLAEVRKTNPDFPDPPTLDR